MRGKSRIEMLVQKKFLYLLLQKFKQFLTQDFHNMALEKIRQLLDDIKDDIAQGEMQTAIKDLLHFFRNDYRKKEYEKQLISISQQYYTLKEENNMGKVAFKDFTVEKNRLATALIEIIDKVEKNIERQFKKETHQLEEENEERTDETRNEIEEEDLNDLLAPPKIETLPILKATNITKKYRSTNFELTLEALELPLNTITALVCENATGKSTLIKILIGERATDKGKLSFPLWEKEKVTSWAAIKKHIAYISQHLQAWHKDLYSSLCYEAVTHGIAADKAEEEVKYIIHRLGLAEYIDRDWQALSGGYKLRFALAKALVWHPQLLVIDEPLAHLDIRAQLVVLQDLKKMVQSTVYPITVLLSSQHIHEVEEIAEQMLFMKNGQVENCGNIKTYQKTRDYNYFELQCDLSRPALKELGCILKCRI